MTGWRRRSRRVDRCHSSAPKSVTGRGASAGGSSSGSPPRTGTSRRAFLADHADHLLTDEADAALRRLIDENPGEQVLELHLELLRAARGGGIDAAYQALLASVSRHGLAETIVAWVGTESWEDARAYFDQHQDALLTDEAEAVAAVLAADNPDQPDLLVHRGLLTMCRVDGPDKAFDLLVDPERLRNLVTGSGAKNDPGWALPRARMLAGLFAEEPDAQLLLVLAALRAEDRDEAARAVANCAVLLGPTQMPALVRRLGDMADAEPDLAAALAWLRSLVAPGSEDHPPDRHPPDRPPPDRPPA